MTYFLGDCTGNLPYPDDRTKISILGVEITAPGHGGVNSSSFIVTECVHVQLF